MTFDTNDAALTPVRAMYLRQSERLHQWVLQIVPLVVPFVCILNASGMFLTFVIAVSIVGMHSTGFPFSVAFVCLLEMLCNRLGEWPI